MFDKRAATYKQIVAGLGAFVDAEKNKKGQVKIGFARESGGERPRVATWLKILVMQLL